MVRPSGANATLVTMPPWPSSRRIFAAAVRLPQPRRFVFGSGEDGSGVRREGHARDSVHVAGEASDLTAGGRVPESRRLVPGSGEDRAAVGANATLVTPAPCPSRRRISRPVAASHSRAVLSTDPVRMVRPSAAKATLVTRPRALESSDLAAARRLPQPRRLVDGSGEDGAAVGRERHAPDKPPVALEVVGSRGRSPHPTAAPSCPRIR